MRGLAADTETIQRIEKGDNHRDLDEDIEQLERELQIMKLRRHGKYSSKGNKGEEKKCRKCSTSHSREEECQAKGKTCYKCEGLDHFARSPACPGKKITAKRREERQSSEDSSSEDTFSNSSRDVKRVHREWPGSRSHAQNRTLKRVANILTPNSTNSKWVSVYIGGQKRNLFTDTGSKFTMITPDMYSEEMGEVVPAKYRLRAWGREVRREGDGQSHHPH